MAAAQPAHSCPPVRVCAKSDGLTHTFSTMRPYRSCFWNSTRTSFRATNSPSRFPDALPKGCFFSGASIPAMRTLCCTLSESRTVIVSPSAILTTVPSRMLAAELRSGRREPRGGEVRRGWRDGNQGYPSVTPPGVVRTLWGKRDEDNDWLSMLLPLEESRRSFSEDLSVNITYRTNLIKRNYIKY